MNITAKLSLFTIFLILGTLAGMSVLFLLLQQRSLLERMRENHIATLNGLAEVSRESLITRNRIGLSNYMKKLRQDKALIYAECRDAGDKIFMHTDAARIGETGEDAASDGDIRAFSVPTLSSGEKTGVVSIGYSTKVLDETVRKTLKDTGSLILKASGLALIVGISAAVVLAGLMTRPIKMMAEGAKRIGKGKLDTVIAVRRRDELGALAEELNQMAVKLKELDQMKQDFVSGVTHEFRAPLNAIDGYLDMFTQGMLGPVAEEMKEGLYIMSASSKRLQRFVDDLLDVAKMEKGKLSFKPEYVHLHPLIREVFQLFLVKARQGGVRMGLNFPDGLPKAYVDAERTKQVVTNLVSNALKFTPKNGHVAGFVQKTDGFLKISVQDTGAGIPKQALEKIFDKFEQVKGAAPVAGAHKGTGLGLAIARAIVEGQGGKIWVESEMGKGTIFHFTVPMNTPPAGKES